MPISLHQMSLWSQLFKCSRDTETKYSFMKSFAAQGSFVLLNKKYL